MKATKQKAKVYNVTKVPGAVGLVLEHLQKEIIHKDRGEMIHEPSQDAYILHLEVDEDDRKACPVLRGLGALEIWISVRGDNVKQKQ